MTAPNIIMWYTFFSFMTQFMISDLGLKCLGLQFIWKDVAEEGDVGIQYKMVLVKLEDGQMVLLINNPKMDQKKAMLRVGTRYYHSELVENCTKDN